VTRCLGCRIVWFQVSFGIASYESIVAVVARVVWCRKVQVGFGMGVGQFSRATRRLARTNTNTIGSSFRKVRRGIVKTLFAKALVSLDQSTNLEIGVGQLRGRDGRHVQHLLVFAAATASVRAPSPLWLLYRSSLCHGQLLLLISNIVHHAGAVSDRGSTTSRSHGDGCNAAQWRLVGKCPLHLQKMAPSLCSSIAQRRCWVVWLPKVSHRPVNDGKCQNDIN
jgi:hypothetical protein